MESSFIIKVKYGDTLRRFNAGIDDDGERLDLNMAGLRKKVTGLFNFAADTEFSLTYTDEDGDVVALVDDDDLYDVIRQGLQFLRIDVQLNVEHYFAIKVKYGDTLRRFYAGINDDGELLDLDMAGLKAIITGLFNFAVDTEFTLTYIDEDGDVVALVDDDDLYDVMCQDMKFLRIELQLNIDKLGKPYAASNQSSTPLRSPSIPPPSEGFNAGVADLLGGVQSEVFSKLDADLKPASASPVLVDLMECLPKMGQPYLSTVSKPGAADSSMRTVSSEIPFTASIAADPDPLTDCGLQAVLPKHTDVDSTCKARKEANTGKATRHVDVPAISDPRSIDSNVDPLYDANLIARKKGKSVSFDTSSSYAANDPVMPPPISQNKRVLDVYMTVHKGIQCDGCGVCPITGPRYKSTVKDDYDLCDICFYKSRNGEAVYIRMTRPDQYVAFHKGIQCDGCGEDPITGPRFKSKVPVQSIDHISRALPHVSRSRALKSARPELESHFILDVNFPDETVMSPSTPFLKIWRMRNSGTSPWFHGMQLVWIGGVKLRSSTSVDIKIPTDGVPVDGELDISVDFTTPELPGRYVSFWRMASQADIEFGQHIWVSIKVDASLKDTSSDNNLQALDLNFPPEKTGPIDSNSIEGVALDEQSTRDRFLKNRDVPTLIPTLSSPVAYRPIINQGVSVPTFLETPSSPSSDPVTNLSKAAPDGPSQVSLPSAPTQEEESENDCEQSLLEELEEMGFKQVVLNKEILRRNGYDLEKSIDDLCEAAKWDSILEEPQ